MGRDLRFTASVPGCDRRHYVSEDDVRVVLSRLPTETWERLRAVHFNDRSFGARKLGYVRRGRREIALCALPPRISLTRFLTRGQSPEMFGARRGAQWPVLAVRRFMLYDVFLHELGHLQVIHEDARTERRKFAVETKAQQFGMAWCKRLWAEPFDHPDPVYHPPDEAEQGDADPDLTELRRQRMLRPNDAELAQSLGKALIKRGHVGEARDAYEQSLALDPANPWTHLFLGNWHYAHGDLSIAVERFLCASQLMPDKSVAFWCLAEAFEAQGQSAQAEANYQKAVEVEPTDRLARRKLRAFQRRVRPTDDAGGSLIARGSRLS